MTIATSASASRNGAGIPARARSTRRSKPTCTLRRPSRPVPRRRFTIATYPSRVEPSLDPAGYVVEVRPGDRIHFLDWGGHGEPGVVLIHGLSNTAWSWAPVARRLVAVRRGVAMDLRVHGLSEAPTGAYR